MNLEMILFPITVINIIIQKIVPKSFKVGVIIATEIGINTIYIYIYILDLLMCNLRIYNSKLF